MRIPHYRYLISTRRRASLTDVDLSMAFGQLAVLLGGGVALIDAVRSLAEFEPRPRVRAVWHRLAESLEQGESLSATLATDTLARHSDVLAVVKAAEIDGSLVDACQSLERSLATRVEHAQRMRAALTYPVIAGVSLILACGFVLWQLVPALSDATSQSALAWHAAPLVWVSRVLNAVAPGVGALGFVAAALMVAYLLVAADGTRGHVRQRLPLIATTDRLIQLATYTDVMRRLRVHGTPLVDSMRDAESCIAFPALQRQLSQARHQVRFGKRLAASLADAPLVPPLVCRLLAVGESTGALDASLQRVSTLLDRQAQHRLERLQTLAPVVVLVMVGGLLLWVIVSIVLPIYDNAISGLSGS